MGSPPLPLGRELADVPRFSGRLHVAREEVEGAPHAPHVGGPRSAHPFQAHELVLEVVLEVVDDAGRVALRELG